MAENQRGKYKRENPTDLAIHKHVIHLMTPSGERALHHFEPHRVRTDPTTGHIYASANLFGRIYKVRMMDKIPAWRVCDEQGRYEDVVFSEVKALSQKGNTTNREEVIAPPHSWGLD